MNLQSFLFAATVASNFNEYKLIFGYLHKDQSTFRMHLPLILRVLLVADSRSFSEHSLT